MTLVSAEKVTSVWGTSTPRPIKGKKTLLCIQERSLFPRSNHVKVETGLWEK